MLYAAYTRCTGTPAIGLVYRANDPIDSLLVSLIAMVTTAMLVARPDSHPVQLSRTRRIGTPPAI